MGMPFNPPNPYGSYFSSGDPAAMAQGAFLPGMHPGASAGVSSAMGSPTAGFNPTMGEFNSSRYRDIAYQQFLSKALTEDPRTSTISNLLLHSMYGENNAGRRDLMKRIGGQSNFDSMMGFMLNMPGVSGLIGGSTRSLALGALGTATSGLRMNGVGMFGDGPLQGMAAESILKTVQNRFYSGTGAAKLDMTQGMNRDQIGGLMMMGGAQGAFAGLDMGKLEMAGGKASLLANNGTMEKIVKFTKDAAKATAALVDIYGNDSVANLLNKAQQITGLNIGRLGNPELISQRLSALRTAAGAAGTDVQTMNDLSAGARRMGMAMGFSSEGAGAMAGPAAINGIFRAREHQMTSASFYMPSITAGEFTARSITNAAGMLQDPMGARRSAIEHLMQTGRISGSGAAGLRSRMGNMGPGDMSSLDAEIQGGYGINLSSYIQSFGGAQGMYEQLNDSTKERLSTNNPDLAKRQEFHIRRIMQQQGIGARNIGAMEGFVKVFSPDNLQSLLASADSHGSLEDLTSIASKDFGGQNDARGFAEKARALSLAMGGTSAAAHQGIVAAMRSNKITSDYLSKGDANDRADNLFRNSPKVPDEARGQNRDTIIQGILERADMKDPRSTFSILAATSPDRIAGLMPGRQLRFDANHYRNAGTGQINLGAWENQVNIMLSEFSRTHEGRALLADLHIGGRRSAADIEAQPGGMDVMKSVFDIMTNPISRGEKLNKFSVFNGTDAGGEYTVLPVGADVNDIKEFGPRGVVMSQIGADLEKRKGKSPITSFMREMGNSLATKQDWSENARVNRWDKIRGGGLLSPAKYKRIAEASGRWFADHEDQMINDFTPENFKTLANDRGLGQQAADMLMRREAILMGRPGHDEELVKIRKDREALEDKNITGHAEGTTKIVGQLKFLMDKTGVEFVNAMGIK